jgi:DNA-binding CsgD family transcriptional regulator
MNTQAQLTKRESEIAAMVAFGGQTKEIAHKLYISEHTVKTTVKNIYRKAEVRSIGQLSAWWFCKHFNISTLINPLLSVLFMVLVGVTEFKSNDQVMRVARTARVRTVKRRQS